MSADMALAASPLFPMPIGDQEPDGEVVDIHGHCAWWCHIQQDFVIQTEGNTVEEHHDEPFCTGSIGMGIAGLSPRDTSTYVNVELFAQYTHGRYLRDALVGSQRKPAIGLGLSSSNDHRDEGLVFIGPGEARTLAATLIRAAEHLEGLATPRPKS